VIQVEHEGDFWAKPLRIMDRKVKVLRKKSIGMVKVQWTCYCLEDVTWENEENMQEEYPQILDNFEEGGMKDSILES
jgi:hypothetical protein